MIVIGTVSAAVLAAAVPFLTHTSNVRAADAPVPPPAPAATPATQPGAAAATVTAPVPAVDPNLLVATAGDIKVTAGQVDKILTAAENSGDPQTVAQLSADPNHGRKEVADRLVTVELLAEQARKENVQGDPDFKLQEDQLLANTLVQKMIGEKGADEKYFDAHKSDFEQVKLRHILIAPAGSAAAGADDTLTDAQAKAKAQSIKDQLDKGADFAKLATENSDDKKSGEAGGELGLVSRGEMVPEFENAAFALKKNEISGPVKTQFGYHIIELEDRVSPTFADVQSQVASRRVHALIDDLSKQTPTTYNSKFITVPATQPATQPAK
ncbi:MAG TPA: peptidylprolyl isomerase [Tepidisphaeraceae bacterium]|nr:peptidylprolyl isomerase [Tepidisphaeraceae bacterium]